MRRNGRRWDLVIGPPLLMSKSHAMSCALYIKTDKHFAFVYMVWLKRTLKMKIFSNVCAALQYISCLLATASISTKNPASYYTLIQLLLSRILCFW